MTQPAQRRRDPQPFSRGWEVAVAGAGGVLIAVVLAALAGLGSAAALWGGGWVWPHGTETITRVIAGLVHGDPGRGLPPDQLHRVAGPAATYACVAVAELTLGAGAAVIGVFISRYLRSGDARSGMATRSEAERALGISQLRAGRAVIRPDRYPSETERRPRARGRRWPLFTSWIPSLAGAHRSGDQQHAPPASGTPSMPGARPPSRYSKEPSDGTRHR